MIAAPSSVADPSIGPAVTVKSTFSRGGKAGIQYSLHHEMPPGPVEDSPPQGIKRSPGVYGNSAHVRLSESEPRSGVRRD